MVTQTPQAISTNLDLSTNRLIATLHADSSMAATVIAAVTVSNLNGSGVIRVTEVDKGQTPNVTSRSFEKSMDGETTLAFNVARTMAAGYGDVEVWIEDTADVSTAAKVVVTVYLDVGSATPLVLDATSQLLQNWYLVDLMQLTVGETRVPGAVLTVTTANDGTGLVVRVTADSNGKAIAFLPAGNFYRWGQHRTFQFVNPSPPLS